MSPAAALLLVSIFTAGAPRLMVRVGPGEVRPLFSQSSRPHRVGAFWLDREPVTNAAFLAFVNAHPTWRRGRVPALFADASYLARWNGPLRLSANAPANSPVVQVSWFAARAYCEARGARLPTEDEWELAAAADSTRADARNDPAFAERVLGWYARPTPSVLPAVGQGEANVWGARDLHDLVWEWVLDFANTPAAEDAGKGCGAAGASQGNRLDYAGYMRSAFRASLDARFTVQSLGFRCARDLETP
jgi:formylglycine-generating enzyme